MDARTASRRSQFVQIVCKCQKAYYARAEVFLKLKIENYGWADSLQNANYCRPTVFVYIEVAFKCMGGCYGVAIILLYSENSYKRKRSALRTPFSYAHKIIKKEGNSCLIK